MSNNSENITTTQIIFPRKLRVYLRWRFSEWQLIPRFVVTKYSCTKVRAISHFSIILLWLFIVFEIEIDN